MHPRSSVRPATRIAYKFLSLFVLLTTLSNPVLAAVLNTAPATPLEHQANPAPQAALPDNTVPETLTRSVDLQNILQHSQENDSVTQPSVPADTADLSSGLRAVTPPNLALPVQSINAQAAARTLNAESRQPSTPHAPTVNGLPDPIRISNGVGSGPSGGSNPDYITEMDGMLYFAADDYLHGNELWKSDGTESGTVIVKDLTPGFDDSGNFKDSSPILLTNVNGTLFFITNLDPNTTTSRELWKSDGTESGTVMVKQISYPLNSERIGVSDTLFFVNDDGTHGGELWKSDGTSGGTVMVKDIYTGSPSSNISYMTDVSGTLFFYGTDGVHGYELWKSDGTESGTVMVKDINPGTGNSFPAHLTAVDGVLFFNADDGTNGSELWKSDGTVTDTVMVKDISSFGDSDPRYFVEMNSTLFFSADDASPNGRELWKSDGTLTGTVMVKNISPSHGDSSPAHLTAVDGTLFFQADDNGEHGKELWKSDGTVTGTVFVKDIRPGSANSEWGDITMNMNGAFFFTAGDPTTYGHELWKSNGTASGTVMVTDIYSGSADGMNKVSPSSMNVINGVLFFRANDGLYGAELWRSNGTVAGTAMVKDIAHGLIFSPNNLTAMNGTLFFTHDDSTYGSELWSYDGADTNAVMVKDINPGAGDAIGSSHLVVMSNTLFFNANNGSNTRLWKSDGSPTGTVPAGLLASWEELTVVSDTLLFGRDTDHLYKHTGTSSGQLKTFADSGKISDLRHLTAVSDTLFFRAYDDAHGFELWKSDGSVAGTVMVKDIYAVITDSFPSSLTNVNGTLFFSADDGVHGHELWKSDGTEAGTVLVKDIYTGSNSSIADSWLYGFSELTNVDGTLFFYADDGVHGRELWKSDGTLTGTTIITDINPGTAASCGSHDDGPFLTNVGGVLYFRATNGSDGYELWKSDGTITGTLMVDDINWSGDSMDGPGTHALAYEYPAILDVNGTPYFHADDGTHGRELWTLDEWGDPEMVMDIHYGADDGIHSHHPYRDMVNVNGLIFFAAAYNHNSSGDSHPPVLWGITKAYRTLSVYKDGNGSGEVTGGDSFEIDCGPECVAQFLDGSVITLIASPLGEWGFERWSGACSGTDPECVITMTAAQAVTATFSKFYDLELSVNGDVAGVVTSTPPGVNCDTDAAFCPISSFLSGTLLTLYASTVPTAVLDSWSGDCMGSSATCELLMDADKTVEATFMLRTATTLDGHAPHPSVVGQPVWVSYTVSAADGGALWDDVQVTLSGDPATCTGAATDPGCSLTPSLAGTRALTATYLGGDPYSSSWATATHTVLKADTTLSITADSPDPSVTGQPITVSFNLTVDSPGGGTPSGSIAVQASGGDTCSASIAVGRCTLTPLSAGDKTITATYIGDDNYNDSQSVVTHTVDKADTYVQINTINPSDSWPNEAVHLDYTLVVSTPGGGTPSGGVTLQDSVGHTCSGSAPHNTCDVTYLRAGPKVITITYAGDANYNPGLITQTYQVLKAPVLVTITNDAPDNAKRFVPFTVEYEVVAEYPWTGTPTGTVKVSLWHDMATCSGPAPSGSCVLTPTIAQGTLVMATYSGNYNFQTGRDLEAHVVMGPARFTAITLTGDLPDPSIVGQAVVVSYTVAPTASTALKLTGDVIVLDDDNNICISDVYDDACELRASRKGTKTIASVYTGDDDFNGSQTLTEHTVERAATTTKISAHIPEPSIMLDAINVYFQVKVAAPGSGTPEYSRITITSDQGDSCSTRVKDGRCYIYLNNPGIRTLTAAYEGDSQRYYPSSGSVTHIVYDIPIENLKAHVSDPDYLGHPTFFTATKSAGTNVVYTWDFGDGSIPVTTTQEHISYTYGLVKVYTVTLQGHNFGSEGLAETFATVLDIPIAGLQAHIDSSTALVGERVYYTATVTTGSNVEYTWDFGDGTPQAWGQHVQHVYGDLGTYNPKVVAVNGTSREQAYAPVISILSPVTGLQAGSNSPGVIGQSTVFTASTTSGMRIKYYWDFGNGSPVQMTRGSILVYEYPMGGNFTAIVTATNGASSQSQSLAVLVQDDSVRGLSAVSDEPTAIDATTTFKASVLAGTSVIYTWDFGDGTPTVTGEQVEHVYDPPGDPTETTVYQATVTAKNSVNEIVETTVVNVYVTPPQTKQVGSMSITGGRFHPMDDGRTRVTGMLAFANGQLKLTGADAIMYYDSKTLTFSGELSLNSDSRAFRIGSGSFTAPLNGRATVDGTLTNQFDELSGFNVSGLTIDQISLVTAEVRGTASTINIEARDISISTNVQNYTVKVAGGTIDVSGFTGPVNLDLGGVPVNIAKLQLTPLGVEVVKASMTLPEVLTGRAVRVTNMHIAPNRVQLETSLPALSGSTLRLVNTQAELVYIGGKYLFNLEGTVSLILPQNRSGYDFSGTLDDGNFKARISDPVPLRVSSLELKVSRVEFEALDEGIQADKGVLNLPSNLGGASKSINEEVVMNTDGLTFDGEKTFDAPKFSIASGAFEIQNGAVTVELAGRGFELTIDGGLGVVVPMVAAIGGLADVKLFLSPSGRLGGEIDELSLSVSFFTLELEDAGIKPNGTIYASAVTLDMSALATSGDAEISLYNVRLGPDGLRIGGGKFVLPDIDLKRVKLSELTGFLMQTPYGYDLGASGKFEVDPELKGGKVSCSGIEIAAVIGFNVTTRYPEIEIMPMAEAPRAIQELHAWSIRRFEGDLKVNCSIPLGQTGYSITQMRGSVNLGPNIIRLSAGLTIEGLEDGPQGIKIPVAMDADTILQIKPYLEVSLVGTVKMFAITVGGASAKAWDSPDSKGFATELWIEMIYYRGSAAVKTWNDARGFSLTGSGMGEVGVPKGKIYKGCLPLPSVRREEKCVFGICASVMSFGTEDMCLSVPSSDMVLGNIRINVGRFNPDKWGMKGTVSLMGYSAGAFVSANGQLSFGNVDQYTLMTPNRAARALSEMQRRNLATLDGLRLAPNADLIQTVTLGQAASTSFVLAGDGESPTLTLRTPGGIVITPDNLPTNVKLYETVEYVVQGAAQTVSTTQTARAGLASVSQAVNQDGAEPQLRLSGETWATTAPVPEYALERMADSPQDWPAFQVDAPLYGPHVAQAATEYAEFRFVHAVPDLAAVNVIVSATHALTTTTGPLPYFKNQSPGAVSDYALVQAGTLDVAVQDLSGTLLLETSVQLAPNGDYSLALVDNGGLSLARISDLNQRLPQGEALVRLVNLGAVTRTLSLHGPGGGLLAAGITYTASSDYARLAGGLSNLRVRDSQTLEELAIVNNTATLNAHIYTVFMLPPADGETQPTAFLHQDSAGQARLRLINAGPTYADLDLYTLRVADSGALESALVEALPFGEAAPYIGTRSGLVTITLRSAGGDSILATHVLTLEHNMDYTFVAADAGNGAPTLLVAEDDNSIPAQDVARVRLINTAWISDVMMTTVNPPNGLPLVLLDGVAFNTISDYANVIGGEHALDLTDATLGWDAGWLLMVQELLRDGQSYTALFLEQADGELALKVFTDLSTAKMVQTMYVVLQPEKGTWEAVLGNDPQSADDYFFTIIGTSMAPELHEVALTHTPGDQQAQVNWRLSTYEAGTRINISANTGPLTYTETYTDPNTGVVSTEVITEYTGPRLATSLTLTETGYVTNTAWQTYTVDLSSLPSGDYRVWVSVDDGRNTPVKKYASADLAVPARAWNTTWAEAGVVVTPSIRRLDLGWTPHPDPDVDAYAVEVTGPGISGTRVISGSFLPFTWLSPLEPHGAYTLTVLALNRRSGQQARAATVTGVPLGAPLSLAVVGSPTVTLELSRSTQITLALSTSLENYPEPADLMAWSVPAGMDLGLPEAMFLPTVDGTQISTLITVTEETLYGLHWMTITAQGVGEQGVLVLPVIVSGRELAINLGGNGSGYVDSDVLGIACPSDCSELYRTGTVISLTATADMDSTFLNWSDGDSILSTNPELLLTLDADQAITANFIQEGTASYNIFLPLVLRANP